MNEYGSIAAVITAIFTVIFFVFQSYTRKFGAPWVPTPYKIIWNMLNLAGVAPGDIVYASAPGTEDL